MQTRKLLERTRNCEYLCMQKREQYKEWSSLLEMYSGFDKVCIIIKKITCEIEESIRDMLMYQYVAESRLMWIDDPDAVKIIREHYFGNMPLELLSDDYHGDTEYVKRTLEEALDYLDKLDKENAINIPENS